MAAVTVGHAWLPMRTTSGVESDVRGLVHLNRRYIAQWADAGYGGFYKLVGVTKVNGVPAGQKQVVVFPRKNFGLVVAGSFVGPDGAFEYRNLAPGTYDVFAIDLTNTYNAVSQTNVQAVPM